MNQQEAPKRNDSLKVGHLKLSRRYFLAKITESFIIMKIYTQATCKNFQFLYNVIQLPALATLWKYQFRDTLHEFFSASRSLARKFSKAASLDSPRQRASLQVEDSTDNCAIILCHISIFQLQNTHAPS